MKNEIEKAVTEMLRKCCECNDSGDAMRFSQAALNLMHTAQVATQVDNTRKPA